MGVKYILVVKWKSLSQEKGRYEGRIGEAVMTWVTQSDPPYMCLAVLPKIFVKTSKTQVKPNLETFSLSLDLS